VTPEVEKNSLAPTQTDEIKPSDIQELTLRTPNMETLEAKSPTVETFSEKEPNTPRLLKTAPVESDDLKGGKEALKVKNLSSKKAESSDSKESTAVEVAKNREKTDSKKTELTDSKATNAQNREKPESKKPELSDSNSTAASGLQKGREKPDLKKSNVDAPHAQQKYREVTDFRKTEPIDVHTATVIGSSKTGESSDSKKLEPSSQAQSMVKAKATISSGHGNDDSFFIAEESHYHREQEEAKAALRHDQSDLQANRLYDEQAALKKKVAPPSKPIVKKKSRKNLVKSIKNMVNSFIYVLKKLCSYSMNHFLITDQFDLK